MFQSGSAVVASTITATAGRRNHEPASELRALIGAHSQAYTLVGKAVHEMGTRSSNYVKASRAEETALVAICRYRAIAEPDRLEKVRYLLEIEARGELDLPEYMQALLHSMA